MVPERKLYVHPTAVLMGDVILGKGSMLGPERQPAQRLRAHRGQRRANIQDNCVMHGFPGQDTVVEEEGHIGHGASSARLRD